MKEIHKALFAFWSQFGVPAYLTGHVPEDAVYPYITFDVVKSEAFSSTILTAFNWHQAKDERSSLWACADMLEKIAKHIPARLSCCDGFIMLYQNSTNFQSYYPDPIAKNVIGGRTSLEVRFYKM